MLLNRELPVVDFRAFQLSLMPKIGRLDGSGGLEILNFVDISSKMLTYQQN
jgi:hypothetical protein